VKRFWEVFDKLLDVMAVLAGIILIFICAAVCYTIGMRYLFNKTTIWLIQTTEYGLCWIVFLATTWLLREGGHITTDIIYGHIHGKTKRWLDIIMFIMAGCACAIMFYYGAEHSYESITRNVTDVRAVTVPKWTVFGIVPIGFLLLTLQFFRMAWDRLTAAGAGR
jgi:C4-dicarboxylate transporter DctQ subunit